MITQRTIVQQNDFKMIGQLAVHCDKEKLLIAITEAQDFDLSELFCDWWASFEVIFQMGDFNEDFNSDFSRYIEEYSELFNPDIDVVEQSVFWDNLMNGGNYTDCKGRQKKHFGMKRIICYYAYSRYVLLNGFNDTATGMKEKTNSFSIPKSLRELEQFAEKYRNMGYEAYKRTLDFLCQNTEKIKFTDSDCKGCGCAFNCDNTQSSTKGFGFRSRIISNH